MIIDRANFNIINGESRVVARTDVLQRPALPQISPEQIIEEAKERARHHGRTLGGGVDYRKVM